MDLGADEMPGDHGHIFQDSNLRRFMKGEEKDLLQDGDISLRNEQCFRQVPGDAFGNLGNNPVNKQIFSTTE